MVLTLEEIALLKALAWEDYHLMMDGPAHRLCENHKIDRIGMFELINATSFGLTNADLEGDQILPMGWPWPEKTLDQIVARLKAREPVMN
jgi:hypothetical protein